MSWFSLKRWCSELLGSHGAWKNRRWRADGYRVAASVMQLEARTLLTTIDLATLTAAQGMTLFGDKAGDLAGFSVSNAGDVNGDGFEDFVVGAENAGRVRLTSTFAGEAYLVFGSAAPAASIDFTNPGTAASRLKGVNQFDAAGHSVSAAGDVNGDGFADLIVGALFADGPSNARADAGDSYVLFGQATLPSTILLNNPGLNGFTITGVDASDRSGISVSDAGDVNGDGFDDLVIGAIFADSVGNARANAGEAYILFGAATFSQTVDLASLAAGAGVTVFGDDAQDRAGISVSGAGDVNGDGFDDVLIGADQSDSQNDSRANAGETYVIFGRKSLPATIDLATNIFAGPEPLGIRFSGSTAGDLSGASVSSAGDVNGDGFDDLLIGARGADAAGTDAGRTFLLLGKRNMTPADLLSTTALRIKGAGAGDSSGVSVSAAGDFNADGFDDLLIGADLADGTNNGRTNSGEAYLIFGQASLPTTLDLANPGTAGLSILGASAGDRLGRSVSNAGDINGDGFDDLLLGAFNGDSKLDGRPNAGEAYIIFGRNGFTNSVTHLGTIGTDTLTGSASGNVMNGDQANDTLLGNGGPDVLRGGQGNDVLEVTDLTFRRLDGGTGADTLRLKGSGHVLDLTLIPDNRIQDIEAINMTGSGDNVLVLNATEVLNLSNTSNTLTVRGNAGDRLDLEFGWTAAPDQVSNGVTFKVLQQGRATLRIETAVTVQIASIDLARLSSGQGSLIVGADNVDRAGVSVSSAGDVNGDGFDDILVSADLADGINETPRRVGKTYLIFGSSSPASLFDLANPGTQIVTIVGAAIDDFSGNSVSGAGDVNGDGFADLIIGAARVKVGSDQEAGAAYIVFGAATLPDTILLTNLVAGLGVTIFGVDAFDNAGTEVRGVGDFNGDGFDDVLIGAPSADGVNNSKPSSGESYVIYGAASMPGVIELTGLNLPLGTTILGADQGDLFGSSLGAAGDVNGDGLKDLIIGSKNGNPGETYIVFGTATPPSTIDLKTIGTAGFRLLAVEAVDRLGSSVSGAGDVNGDGFDDLLAGAREAAAARNLKSRAGETYVIFGKAAPTDVTLTGTPAGTITFFGADANDESGVSVSHAGDINADGCDDLIIGAANADSVSNSRIDAGESFVYFGRANPATSVDLLQPASAGLKIFGATAGEASGSAVSAGGDVNGDGFDDVLIGAKFADGLNNLKSDSGEAYLLFGSDVFTRSVTQNGAANSDLLTGSATADFIVGGRSNDTLIGLAGADVLIGAQGNDLIAVNNFNFARVDGGTGTDTLRIDGGGLTLSLITKKDSRLLDIEVIDITGTGNNTLVLNKREVLNISETSNTLLVRRNTGDDVNKGAGWTQQANETIDGQLFEVFTEGAAILKIQIPSAAPQISGFSVSKAFAPGDPAIILADTAVVDDRDSLDFDGGELLLATTVNGESTDLFSIRHQGLAAGQIGLNGNEVLFSGGVIGFRSGGSNGNPLRVTLNSNATALAVRILIRNLTWNSTSATPSPATRTISLTLSDGDGAISSPVTKLIVIL